MTAIKYLPISELANSNPLDLGTAPEANVESGDKDVDEVTDLFKGLAKKKKSKKPKEGETAEGGDEAAPAVDGEFDPTALKKKKKKKSTKTADGGDFDAKLAEAGVGENGEGENEDAGNAAPTEVGDLEKGTGIWSHNSTQSISYPLLLTRFFTLLHNHHPDMLSSGSRSYKIPPPQCLREGNKKTIFANIAEICRRMKRTDEHVTQFLFAELGTSGSVDGSRRLVIKGRFQQKQIENVLRRYIGESSSPRVLTWRIWCAEVLSSRIRYLQDMSVTGHGAQQGRESSILRYLQLLRKQTECHGN